MKIELYLDGNLVEINKDIDFVLNRQFTELTDLTSIIVDYSKTIKVPMSPRNNELFNYVYKLEHQVLIGEDIISYDPSQKIPMVLTYNGSLVLEGYAVLNSVNLKDKTYEINLYGQLGKIFSDLKEKTLKDYRRNDSPFWSKIRMNTRTIAQSFQDENRIDNTSWTYFFGFAPQLIGKSDTIDTTTYEEYGTGDVKNFADDINTTRGITYGDTYVKDGFDFNQYMELRTYMTRPYVYADSLIRLVRDEINSGDYDGYTMEWEDESLWENSNVQKRLCYFPGNESIVDNGDSINGMVSWDTSELTFSFPGYYLPSTTTVDLPSGYTYTTSGGVAIIQNTGGDMDGVTCSLNCDGIVVRDRVTGFTSGNTDDIKWGFYNLTNIAKVPVRYIAICDANNKILKKLYLCDNKIVSVQKQVSFLDNMYAKFQNNAVYKTLKNLGAEVVVPNSTTWTTTVVNNSYAELTQVYNFGTIGLNGTDFKFKKGCDLIDIEKDWMVTENISSSDFRPLVPFKNDKYKTALVSGTVTWDSYFRPIPYLNVSSNNYRSGSTWSIVDILGNDFNPFTWLIDFVKMHKWYFDIDYVTKTITLKSKYFKSGVVSFKNVEVDYSKDVIIEPIVEKYSNVNFGYRANESKKGIKYLKNNGLEYGDLIIETPMKINHDLLSLTPDEELGVFIPTKLNALTWTTLNSNAAIKYTNELFTNRMINTLNKDGEIEYYPFYAFRWPNAKRPRPEQQNIPFYYLSDDTPNQKNSGSYTYLDHASSGWGDEVETIQGGNNVYYLLALPYLPQFDNYFATQVTQTSMDISWCTFGVPAEVYNGNMPYSDDTSTYCIYTDRWERYLNELFNVNNKKVTCYVRMSYPEYINFKFDQLFVIDNNIFLVNKIIDFNPNSTEPTKVELIQITNVANLYDNNL